MVFIPPFSLCNCWLERSHLSMLQCGSNDTFLSRVFRRFGSINARFSFPHRVLARDDGQQLRLPGSG
jgi:hypothetical protein